MPFYSYFPLVRTTTILTFSCFTVSNIGISSLAIFNVDAKLQNEDSNVSYNNNSQRYKSALLSASSQAGSLLSRTRRKFYSIDCRRLLIGQFKCPPVRFDDETQQPAGCNSQYLVPINCTLRDGLICDDDNEDNYQKEPGANKSFIMPYVTLGVYCDPTNGYSFEVTLLLSIFLGMFGADRFYLGYGAIGLLKMSTLGFLFLGQFIDIILIAMQIVRPADGSNYIIKYFGPNLHIVQGLGDFAYNPTTTFNGTKVLESKWEGFYYLPTNYTSP